MVQTTGKTLEEVDLLFAKDSVKDSILANEVMAHHHEKGDLAISEEVE